MTDMPVVSGTIPATGWIQIKQWNEVEYTSGALTITDVSANSSGASKVGFLEIMGDDAKSIVANRLGTFNVTGAWFSLGSTSGSSNQTIQIPNHGTKRFISGVFIEKTSGQKDYEFYPNAGTATTIGTEAERGKVVWIDDTGLIRIGHNGTDPMGYTPVANLEVVIGNIFFCTNTTSARNEVCIPHATPGTRYDYTTTGGGVLNIDKCESSWYLSIVQAYSCNVSNSGFVDSVYVQEVATPMTWSNVGVGNKPNTALVTSGLFMYYNYVGGVFNDCVFTRVSLATSGSYTAVIQDTIGFTFNRCAFRANTRQGHSSVYSIYGLRIKDTTFNDCTIIQGYSMLSTCEDIVYNNTAYINNVSGTTPTTYPTHVWYTSANSVNCTFNGLKLPVTDCHPYTSLLASTYGASNIKLRNIGTRTVPLNLGTTNNCAFIYVISSNTSNVKVQRVYASNTRTGIMTGNNSCHEITEENVFGDYADATDVMACINMKRKGMGGTGVLNSQISIYGTHWMDSFINTTEGRIAILMNEASTITAAQVTLGTGSSFTSSGGLYMPNVDHTVTFEMPEYTLGHTGFVNTTLIMAGGTSTKYNYNYAIDKNDNAGWSAMTTDNFTPTTLGTALSNITGIDASKGFKLRLKITTITGNTNAITSVYVKTTSSATAQDYQYPLDTVPLSFAVKHIDTGSPLAGARLYLVAGAGGPLAQGTLILNTLTDVNGNVTGAVELSGNQPVVGRVRFGTTPNFYKTVPISEIINSTSGLSLNISMIPDA
jgi:hypothetical protein